MSTAELDEVQALLEHVLPDPGGYAQRLLLQVMTRWGQAAGSGTATSYPGANAFYTTTALNDVTVDEPVVTPEQPTDSEAPIDIRMLLAAALGACDCWGLQPDCQICQGHGFTGWTQPDLELFAEFVRPVVEKLSSSANDGQEQNDTTKVGKGDQDHQTSEGLKE
jgi:hypothetical protein